METAIAREEPKATAIRGARRLNWIKAIAVGLGWFAFATIDDCYKLLFPATLTLRCTTADGAPLKGVRFQLRSLDEQPQLQLYFEPAHPDADDAESFVARIPFFSQNDDDAEEWFRSGPKRLIATSTSHGQLITTIDRDGAEIRFERPAFAHLTYDPPFDPNDLERRYVRAVADPYSAHQYLEFNLASRLVDGVAILGPLQPGEYHFDLGRHPPPRPPGSFGGSYGRRGRGGDPYTLVSGVNNVTINRSETKK